MSDSDIRGKIEDVLNKILSRKYNAKIKIKFVDEEETAGDKGRNNNRIGRTRSNARKRD